MPSTVRAPLILLVVALVALGASIAWATTRDGRDGEGAIARYGPGMMAYAPYGGGERVATLDDARRQAGRFAERLGLDVGEVMEFSNHFYAELTEDGEPAAEVIVEPNGAVHLEYGPAMMWNTRFGMMSDFRLRGGGPVANGMMGGSAGPALATGASELRPAGAPAIAERWVAARDPALSAEEPERFPGYHTLRVVRDGQIEGMLSVNDSTRVVRYHWWHGRFLGMRE